jgi:methyltransferase
MPESVFFLGFITLQRLGELLLSARHTRSLLATGAYEVGARHYPAMVALHASWLATLWYFGWNHALVLPLLALFAVLQVARVWVLRTLGERWTTRIIVPRSSPPITTGPYRFVRHPNYLVVALELPCASLALGLGLHAVVFGALNLAMLAYRMHVENAAYGRRARGYFL